MDILAITISLYRRDDETSPSSSSMGFILLNQAIGLPGICMLLLCLIILLLHALVPLLIFQPYGKKLTNSFTEENFYLSTAHVSG